MPPVSVASFRCAVTTASIVASDAVMSQSRNRWPFLSEKTPSAASRDCANHGITCAADRSLAAPAAASSSTRAVRSSPLAVEAARLIASAVRFGNPPSSMKTGWPMNSPIEQIDGCRNRRTVRRVDVAERMNRRREEVAVAAPAHAEPRADVPQSAARASLQHELRRSNGPGRDDDPRARERLGLQRGGRDLVGDHFDSRRDAARMSRTMCSGRTRAPCFLATAR